MRSYKNLQFHWYNIVPTMAFQYGVFTRLLLLLNCVAHDWAGILTQQYSVQAFNCAFLRFILFNFKSGVCCGISWMIVKLRCSLDVH